MVQYSPVQPSSFTSFHALCRPVSEWQPIATQSSTFTPRMVSTPTILELVQPLAVPNAHGSHTRSSSIRRALELHQRVPCIWDCLPAKCLPLLSCQCQVLEALSGRETSVTHLVSQPWPLLFHRAGRGLAWAWMAQVHGGALELGLGAKGQGRSPWPRKQNALQQKPAYCPQGLRDLSPQ